MLERKKSRATGSTTIEYSILLPLVFICVFSVIIVFLALHQKAIIQNLAEETAESLSRQWNYESISQEEVKTGAYKRETYEEREVYWNLTFWNNKDKEAVAESYILREAADIGPLKPSRPSGTLEAEGKGQFFNENVTVSVKYSAGLPSTLTVDVSASYILPGAGLIKLIGLGGNFIVKGHADATIYDSKDMINTTDFCMQMLRETKMYQAFTEKTEAIKKGLTNVATR